MKVIYARTFMHMKESVHTCVQVRDKAQSTGPPVGMQSIMDIERRWRQRFVIFGVLVREWVFL